MHDWEARAKLLEAENDDLRARVGELKRAIGLAAEAPLAFGFTRSENIIFGVLLNNRAPRPETFLAALYGLDADDPPEEKILDVWICRMRKKLKPHGIEITTHWGECWEMPEASKARARELTNQA